MFWRDRQTRVQREFGHSKTIEQRGRRDRSRPFRFYGRREGKRGNMVTPGFFSFSYFFVFFSFLKTQNLRKKNVFFSTGGRTNDRFDQEIHRNGLLRIPDYWTDGVGTKMAGSECPVRRPDVLDCWGSQRVRRPEARSNAKISHFLDRTTQLHLFELALSNSYHYFRFYNNI